VAAAIPAPRAVMHHKWMVTPISFDASDYPKRMAGAGQLSLVISPTIANIRLYHVLINGGAMHNLINLIAVKKLQIPMSKLSAHDYYSGWAGVNCATRLYLPPSHVRNFRELPRREHSLRCRRGQPPLQCDSREAGPVPVYCSCSLCVPGPKDAIP
jgi:hypothetical protein